MDLNIFIIILLVTNIVVMAVLLIRSGSKNDPSMTKEYFEAYGKMIFKMQREQSDIIDRRLDDMNSQFNMRAMENEQKMENLRNTVDQRLGRSFKDVNDRLEEVYKGLGEMQNLANGVGDLKKVLTNVKTRGILGEYQLKAIIEDIMAPEQYEENIRTRGSGSERVEFAIKLPGTSDRPVYLPIDAKFPGTTYMNLVNAYEYGDKALIDVARKNLENAIKREAKDIKDKYVEPPYTTDFGIMFLPFEGLYSEVLQMGLLETLQRDYNVVIAGPATTAAILNSLQMGFRTLAIEKRSSEVWQILGGVKMEFDKFEEGLEQTKKRINQANEELDKLVGTRTRQIKRQLREVSYIDEDIANSYFNEEE